MISDAVMTNAYNEVWVKDLYPKTDTGWIYMIRNILLDLDDTILDFHKAEHIALAKTLKSFGLEPSQAIMDRYSEINQWHWKQLELGLLTRKEVLVGRYRQLFDEHSIDVPAEDAQALYEKNLSIGHYFIPGAEELLERLYGKYRLYLASNGTAVVQHGRLESSGIEKYFDKIFISEEIGADKPSTEFFEAAFSAIPDFKKSETVMIGDSLTSDIKGGIASGIHTVWFNPRGKKNETLFSATPIIPETEIKSLKEIDALMLEL